ncbi:class I SAM-dependent methyltransferase [Corynebacterium mendelii]|uniref:Class I SAM-dependent methyltransferase n=1 Tax=Corynebacterium mendelii TaxID=2765362 RepID=A0A939DZV4_9CORY|nr:class I SAM-dependent methyltransferase [Corynebacterium mendelii]MBN9644320.1 class I SAM-dependent methyltransferase [Corynebacterium mendelii]
MTIPDNNAIPEMFSDNLGATLICTIEARAHAGDDYRIACWNDDEAKKVWQRLTVLAEQSSIDLNDYVVAEKSNRAGTIHRALCIDRQIREFRRITDGPIQVVTLGVGLCTRATRVPDIKDVTFFGIDRPEVVATRKAVMPEDPTELIGASVTAPGWMDDFAHDKPTCFVAEGLVMYLTADQVRQILADIASTMTAACWFVSDSHHSRVIGKGQRKAEITNKTGSVYTFGSADAESMANLGGQRWQAVSAIDTMGPIGPMHRAISTVFRLLRKAELFSVKTIAFQPTGAGGR